MHTLIYTHKKTQATKKVIATGSLRAIKDPVNLIFAATSFIQQWWQIFFRGAIIPGIYKWCRK
jgi:hypothetical protein